MTKRRVNTFGCVAVVGFAFFTSLAHGATPDPSEVVQKVGKGVAQVGASRAGNRGASMFLLEEQHDSRLQQIQHAIVMTRLHDQFGLRDIVLEGYLEDRARIDFTPYRKMFRDLDTVSRAAIVVRFLREGEISGSEFVALVFDDINLHPCEHQAEHAVTLSDNAAKGLMGYVRGIAQVDPSWIQKKLEILNDEKKMISLGTTAQKELFESIRNYAVQKSVSVSDSERAGMDEYLAFWNGRTKADRTMFEVARVVADIKGKTSVVMNIGALHTRPQVELCSKEGRPFAVVTPLAKVSSNKKSNLTTSMYERKLLRHSVFSTGLSRFIETGGGLKKPESVLAQQWFQTKAETYTFVNRIVDREPPKPPSQPPSGEPPFGFGDDEFQGRWISIDPKKLLLAPTDSRDKKKRAVLIPIVFKETGKTVWAKAALMRSKKEDGRSVESILRSAMNDVDHEAKTPETAEDGSGRIQVEVDVTAGFAESLERARKIQLVGS